MVRAIQIYAIVNLIVIGLSHVFQPRVWVDFVAFLRDHGKAGVFTLAFLNLLFGSIIVAFHNVWSGLPAVLTLVGWVSVVKALVYFAFPAFGLRKLEIPSYERAYVFVYIGVVFLVIAAVLGYHIATTS